MRVLKLNVGTTAWHQVSKYLFLVSPERRKRILRFQKEHDKVISLLSELLIRQEAAGESGLLAGDIQFEYNGYGKPYIKNIPWYHFSLSHSRECIVFVHHTEPVGIDMEYISNRRVAIQNSFFTDQEREFIKHSEKADSDFYRIWTCKEAYVKMLGTGLYQSIRKFDVLSKENVRKFFSVEKSGYMITICCENMADNDVMVKEIEMKEILHKRNIP